MPRSWPPFCTLGRTLGFTALALALAFTACATPTRAPEPDPVAALDVFVDALERRDFATAWAMMTPEARGPMTESEFALWAERRYPSVLGAASAALELAQSTTPVTHAKVQIGDKVVTMVKAPEGWRVVSIAPTSEAGSEVGTDPKSAVSESP